MAKIVPNGQKVAMVRAVQSASLSEKLPECGRMPAAALSDWIQPLPVDPSALKAVLLAVGGIAHSPHNGFRLEDIYDAARDGRLERYIKMMSPERWDSDAVPQLAEPAGVARAV